MDRYIPKRLFQGGVRFFANIIVYGIGLLLFTHQRYYVDSVRPEALSLLWTLFKIYLVVGLPLSIWSKEKKNKSMVLIKAIVKLPRVVSSYSYSFVSKIEKDVTWSNEEKVALLFALVKLFYVPIMLGFSLNNLDILNDSIKSGNLFEMFSNFRFKYVHLLNLFFTIDTLIFSFGYLFESEKLKNVVKSVEPTFFGWAVALATYPPFNEVTNKYLGWYSRDYFFFPDPVVDIPLKIAVVFLIGIYLWATISLGTKSSNLTNRGIVTWGAYRWVRHPAYISKVTAWWIMMLPRISLVAIISLIGWSVIYYLRAITEEKHLMNDADYRKYIKKTRFRFIPNLI